jgi:hypothetical protein
MKIHLWNAFASNNSGSYTIVGSFRDTAVAAEVAAELAAVVAAHSAWLEGEREGQAVSPLEAFAGRHGLELEEGVVGSDAWPQYGPPPEVAAMAGQVVLHAPYTVTMPRLFGQWFYRKGGEVDVTLDHSHDPLICQLGVWWPLDAAERASAMVAELAADAAVAAALEPAADELEPVAFRRLAWRTSDLFGEPSLLIGAVFGDLVAGIRALAALCDRHEVAYRQVRIIEALVAGEPLAHFGPGSE